MTVAEQTLARLHERLADLSSELDVETDRGWALWIEREIAAVKAQIERQERAA